MASVQGDKGFTVTVGMGTVPLMLAMEMRRVGLEGAPGEHQLCPENCHRHPDICLSYS